MAIGTTQTQAPLNGGPTLTVSEVRTDVTWWTTPDSSKTPYASLFQFR